MSKHINVFIKCHAGSEQQPCQAHVWQLSFSAMWYMDALGWQQVWLEAEWPLFRQIYRKQLRNLWVFYQRRPELRW